MPRSALLALVLASFLIACTSRSSDAEIDLSELQPMPIDRPTGIIPLRIAIANVISPTATLESYTPLLEYMSQKLQRPVDLVQGRNYAEINDLVRRGEVDLAFVCSSAYVAGHDSFDMQLLVAPRVHGETVYYSELIVPSESPVTSMDQLRGAVFAFTDPMSNSGRLYPTFLVQELGETPSGFFDRTFFTYSHDEAIRAVAEGLADAAAVDSLVLDYTIARSPEIGERVRVIHRSPPFGIPPIVVSPGIRPQLRAELLKIFLEMDESPQGRLALAELDIDEFTLIDASAYDSVHELASQVQAFPREQP
ncbi:MAG: phosphate/phosphite/phosphonate ABC transporter substrate-binding protein [Anaerolineae bacterium]|nr:MAG: phosphate/phosphite/phosphonate ABC transporter substrate-binding protein [Anaerolineae bacterium]